MESKVREDLWRFGDLWDLGGSAHLMIHFCLRWRKHFAQALMSSKALCAL